MTTAIAKKEETQLATVEQNGAQEILKSDVIIPKLLLMQGLSDLVSQRKAQQGDIVRSTTGEVVGGPDKPLSFIPITFQNLWMLTEEVNGKFEWRATEPRTARNENEPWEFEKHGSKWRRVKVVDCYALLPQDIEAEAKEIAKFQETGEMPDLNKTLLPVVISFRSTSYNAGRAVVTHFTKAAGMAKYGAKPYGFTLDLSCHQDKNDKGSYYVFTVNQGKAVAKDVVAKAEEWYHILSTQKVQVDNSDDVADTSAVGESDKF